MQIPPPLTLLPILISLIALWVAVKNYHRKNGIELRGAFQIASSRFCEDRYVSNILIENIKDRSTTIFDIYLKVGHSIYIHLIEFEENPLILKPYETYQNQFGPIEFYGFNLRKVDINDLLANHKLKKQLILSTSDGKYAVPRHIGSWSPVIEFFNNHLTGILQPVPSRYKNTDLGSNIKYIVEIIDQVDKTQIVPVGRNDHDIGVFKNFRLTKESLASIADLELFLLDRQIDGNLNVKDFSVYDVDAWREQNHREYREKTVKISADSFVRYHLLGRWFTYRQNREIRRKNKLLARPHR
ncbi:hypothetical protein N1078_18425 [Pseudomonas sp. MIL19]|uniref:hypothetical protein n=1 Tax=Pseudomonas sp. MIL19 TaxID=2976979 RepID=UPI002363E586|nr:hypothetical protein [Pseudomonas sp. MIL19]MDD2162539.1 hypothetical protein [Pseudomonas sp. MIL19]